MRASAPAKPKLVSAGVVRFFANNLEQIIGRHRYLIPAQPKLELQMLLDAIGELRPPSRG